MIYGFLFYNNVHFPCENIKRKLVLELCWLFCMQFFVLSNWFIISENMVISLEFNPFMPKLTIFGFSSNNFTDRGYETRLTQLCLSSQFLDFFQITSQRGVMKHV